MSIISDDIDQTPEQKKQQKFQNSAFGRYLSTCSDFSSTSITDSFRTSRVFLRPNQNLTPIRIRRKMKTPHKPSFAHTLSIPALTQNLPPHKYTVYWSLVPSVKWNPETRQQASLTVVGNNFYLIGGISRGITQDVNVFSPFSSDWERVNTCGLSEPRFGHSALAYCGSIFVFGGGTNFNSNHGLRECLSGVNKYTPHKKEWGYIKTSGTYISARKCHAASIIGKHMLVNGGFNDKRNVLRDTAVFNLEKYTWHAIDISNTPPGLAFHTAVTVVSKASSLSIYNITDAKIPNYGIYIFGGINGKKQACNELYRIIPGTRPLRCIIPQTSGIPPSPRFMHSMAYCSSFNNIVVFGGRVDIKNTMEYTCFNDVHVLFIENLMWASTCVNGNIPKARSGHCSTAVGSEIYIFGGVSNTVYCSSDLYKLEINQNLIAGILKSDERRNQRKKQTQRRNSADYLEVNT